MNVLLGSLPKSVMTGIFLIICNAPSFVFIKFYGHKNRVLL